MKKIIIETATLCLLLSLTSGVSQAAEAVYPAVAKSDADLILKADDKGEEGGVVDPGGEGEIDVPEPGEGGDGGIVNPGQKTPLRISLLTAFNFGEIKMSGNTKEYKALLPTVTFKDPLKAPEERPNFVQITDNRGTNAGWRLQAKISNQFTNKTSVLTGSTITLDNGWTQPQANDLLSYAPVVSKPVVLSEDASKLIVKADEDKGMGTWNILYGSLDGTKGDAKESVTLEIPGKVKKSEGAYKAKVEWTLTDTPGN